MTSNNAQAEMVGRLREGHATSDAYGEDMIRAAAEIERMAGEIAALRAALAPFADRRTIEEELADPTPPVWASATPERRIEMIGERKRQHDGDILRARQALGESQ